MVGIANHTQLGDPVKSTTLIHEVTCGEKSPAHLYRRPDTLDRLQVTLTRIEQDLAPWRAKYAATARTS